MSDKMRWRYGDTNPVVAAVDSATVIEIGDLVWQDTDDAKPASMLTVLSYQCDDFRPEAEDYQKIFANNFLGVAMQRSRSGDTAPVRVATTGVFEFDCPSGTFELGELIGPAVGNTLKDQQVVKVFDPKLAIGLVAKLEHEPTTKVLADIRSKVMAR